MVTLSTFLSKDPKIFGPNVQNLPAKVMFPTT